MGFYWDPIDNPERQKLAKFTENGELLWSKDMILVGDSKFFSTFLTANNEIIGAGSIMIDSLGPLQGHIGRFDLDGNILWERTIIEDQFSEGIYLNQLNNGLELDNGDLVFCGLINDDNSGTPGLRSNT